MAQPGKKTRERNIFTEIELKIMLINEQIKNHEKSIQKAKKMSGWQGPAGVSGIDYSREPVASVHISFAEGLRMIELDETRIRELKAERADLRRQKKRIEKIYESLDGLDGLEAQVYYLRIICKMTQEAAADEAGVSRRHFQRIESAMRDEGLI